MKPGWKTTEFYLSLSAMALTAMFASGLIGDGRLYKALTVISTANQISPSMVARGFAESLTTTIFGLTILLVSAVAWYVLHGRYRAVR